MRLIIVSRPRTADQPVPLYYLVACRSANEHMRTSVAGVSTEKKTIRLREVDSVELIHL